MPWISQGKTDSNWILKLAKYSKPFEYFPFPGPWVIFSPVFMRKYGAIPRNRMGTFNFEDAPSKNPSAYVFLISSCHFSISQFETRPLNTPFFSPVTSTICGAETLGKYFRLWNREMRATLISRSRSLWEMAIHKGESDYAWNGCCFILKVNENLIPCFQSTWDEWSISENGSEAKQSEFLSRARFPGLHTRNFSCFQRSQSHFFSPQSGEKSTVIGSISGLVWIKLNFDCSFSWLEGISK